MSACAVWIKPRHIAPIASVARKNFVIFMVFILPKWLEKEPADSAAVQTSIT
jgi:hypothetical protein